MNAQTIKDRALDARQQNIVMISALTATGDLENLRTALNSGLDGGLTVNEIKDVLVQMYAYCGFPRSLNAINTFMTVLEERKQRGQSTIGENENGNCRKQKRRHFPERRTCSSGLFYRQGASPDARSENREQ